MRTLRGGGSRRAAEQTRARLEAKYVRNAQWNGLLAGDVVRVRGERGARFVFRCHVLNRSNDATWVEVDELALPRRNRLGPPAIGAGGEEPGAGDEVRPVVRRQRSFAEDRIVPPKPRSRRRRPAQGIPLQDTPLQGVQGSFELDVQEALSER